MSPLFYRVTHMQYLAYFILLESFNMLPLCPAFPENCDLDLG